MKWFTLCGAIGIALISTTNVQAGLFSHGCGAEKSCGCALECPVICCKPVICRPTCCKTFNYQRSCCKPVCCTQTAPSCCAPQACAAPTNCCAPQVACAAPTTCCAPPVACAAPMTCCAPTVCCDNSCCQTCCPEDACEIAHYINKAQTACYAKHRRKAVDKLGDKFNCGCNPEVMCALVYALNDCDERVRKEAADEIGDQLRKCPCCCSPQVICALSQALGDCDRGVRREAEEALRVAGYDVDDCNNCCFTACAPSCGGMYMPQSMPAPEAAPMDNGAPPPAPPADMSQRGRRGTFAKLAGIFR